MTTMTSHEKAMRMYRKGDGRLCPYCNHPEPECTDISGGFRSVSRTMACKKCGRVWTLVFTLKAILEESR
jgi:hypothetical protein